MSLEPDRERSGSLRNVSRSPRVAEVEQGEKVMGRHNKGPANILVTRSAG
jgi:hypothetical protein